MTAINFEKEIALWVGVHADLPHPHLWSNNSKSSAYVA